MLPSVEQLIARAKQARHLDPDYAMPRLFTGVELPPDIGQALASLRGGLPGARWIDPENYHLTLRFIGDVDDVDRA